MATQWEWGSVLEQTAIGAFIRLCNRRFGDLQRKVASLVSLPAGGGTATVLPKWDSAGTGLSDSAIKDTGTQVQITARPLRMDNGPGNGVIFKNAAGTLEYTALAFTASDELSLLGAWLVPISGGAPLLPSVDDLQDLGSAAKRIRHLALSGDARIKGVAYVWPSANASGVLTNNGSGTLTWAAGGGSGGGNGGTATLSFGATGSTSASVTVTGQAWVTGSNAIVCTVADDARAEDAAIEGLTLTVANQVVGTGFDIIGAPAIGDFVGDVTVAFVGV